MYKMMVLDLDGTLLNDYKQISQENINWIKKAYNEKGVIPVIATGRPLCYVNEICELYGDFFANYVISCNGASIKDIANDRYIHKVSFTNEEVLNLRNIYIEEKADYIMFYTDENVITEAKNKDRLKNVGVSINKESAVFGNMEDEIKNNPHIGNLLCTISGDISTLEKIIKKIGLLDEIESTSICNYLCKTDTGTFKSKYIDVMKKSCSKKDAIHILADKLGIKQEEIIVMGDGGNDLPMFDCAGLKVAMENAEPYLKEKADFVTDSNNENGVAKAIQKIIFLGE